MFVACDRVVDLPRPPVFPSAGNDRSERAPFVGLSGVASMFEQRSFEAMRVHEALVSSWVLGFRERPILLW